MEGGVYVSNTLFEKSGHISKISLNKFKEGYLSDNEILMIAEHISLCENCADVLANSFDNDELACAPVGFQQEILSKIKDKKSNRTQFVFYSMRVVMAASIALMFVFSNSLNILANNKTLNVNPVNLSSINTVNVNLDNFSQKIINMEVFKNEK